MNTYPTSADIRFAHQTATYWDKVIEEDFQSFLRDEEVQAERADREEKAWLDAHTSLSNHLHDLGCNTALMAWAADDVSLDAANDEEGAQVYAQLAAALGFDYDVEEDDRAEVDSWLERELNERYTELLEGSALTLAA